MAEFEQDEINDPRAFERFLRGQGFSRSRAKAITAKEFGCDATSDQDRKAIADLVSQLSRSRQSLETKGSFLSSLLRGGGKAGAVADVIGNVKRAYRAIRPTPMPLHIFPGRSAQFSMGMRRLSGNQVVTVNHGYDRLSSREFHVRIEYWKWTTNGPLKAAIKKDVRVGYENKVGTMEFGDIRDLETWLGKEWDRLNARNALDRFDSVVSRVDRVISSGLAPKGVINFKSYALPKVRINAPGESRSREFPFVVR